MKTIFLSIAIIIFSSLCLKSQQEEAGKTVEIQSLALISNHDSLKTIQKSSDSSFKKCNDSCKGQKIGGQKRMRKNFIDKDGDGINDNCIKDRFIDKDGDGINDLRCKGMGLGLQKRNRYHGGKK